MEEKMFNELMESIWQGKAIMLGEMEPSKKFVIDVKAIRKQFRLSQNKFSQLLEISIGTLRNWEQGRRKPEGLARNCYVLQPSTQKQY